MKPPEQITKAVITLEMPVDGAKRLLQKWKDKDPEMMKHCEENGIVDIEIHETKTTQPTDTKPAV